MSASVSILFGKRPKKLTRGISFESRPGKPSPFLARWREPGGKKRSRSFATEAERWAFVTAWEKRRKAFGQAAIVAQPVQVEAWKLFSEIADGADPLEVARWWVKYRPPVSGKMRVIEALERYRETFQPRDHTALHLKRLENAFGDKRLGTLEGRDLAAWVDGLANPSFGAPMAPYTRLHHFRTAKRFFKAAVQEHWMDRNPMDTLKPPEKEDIYVLPVEDAQRLFEAAGRFDRSRAVWLLRHSRACVTPQLRASRPRKSTSRKKGSKCLAGSTKPGAGTM